MLLYLRQFSDNPPALFAYIAAMLVAYVTGIAFHEFCHAWAAYQLGDDTAARMGRLTLNPIKHLDPLGSILLVLVGFGWGKPTPVNPYRLRNGVKRGNMLVAAAGPASNFFFAALAALPFKLGLITTVASFDQIGNATRGEIFGLFLLFVVYINVLLGVFNLIPINPLDGFKVVAGLLPGQASREFSKLAAWGPGILMALFAISFILPQYNVLGWIIGGMGDRVLAIIT